MERGNAVGYDGLGDERCFVPWLEDVDEFWEWFVTRAYLHHVDAEDVRPIGELYVDLVALWCSLEDIFSHRGHHGDSFVWETGKSWESRSADALVHGRFS